MSKYARYNLPRLLMWAQDLETTQYGQGKYKLNPAPLTFCCLGIAELTAAREFGLDDPDMEDKDVPGTDADLFFGGPLNMLDLWFPSALSACSPAYANDDLDKSFVEIAAAVRDLVAQEKADRKAEAVAASFYTGYAR